MELDFDGAEFDVEPEEPELFEPEPEPELDELEPTESELDEEFDEVVDDVSLGEVSLVEVEVLASLLPRESVR